MKIIVAVDKEWGIGKANGLLFELKEDMKYFREKTFGKVVVMGSNTLFSLPQGKPLPNRTNIVLFPQGYPLEGCEVVDSLEELFNKLKQFDTEDIFIIGGAMFYRTMLNYCDTAYITKVEAKGNAEVFFENLDSLDNWELTALSEPVMDEGYAIRFAVYKNNSVKRFEKGGNNLCNTK